MGRRIVAVLDSGYGVINNTIFDGDAIGPQCDANFSPGIDVMLVAIKYYVLSNQKAFVSSVRYISCECIALACNPAIKTTA
jgi:hypothetical protein